MPVCFGISFAQTFLNQVSALVEIYTNGNVSVFTGGVEMGQRFSTKIAEIAVKALVLMNTASKKKDTPVLTMPAVQKFLRWQ
ncbi:xanthine dehydrogenase molybdopterin binding subunit (plasmid) [Nostoc carneum NIES-2107]|nr:xanthine dehydrogenase molybdopterin binding subunit [Nostoc carneum NIES-2107]